MSNPLLLGVEIGGTKLQLGLGHGDGRLIAIERRQVVPASGAVGICDQISDALQPLLERVGAARGDLNAVGIGFGGPVDASRGVVTTSNQIQGWSGFPLASWMADLTSCSRVGLENDADTAALGEYHFGAGEGRSPLLYVTVGSGIGGGLVMDGNIYHGNGAGAVEIGHLLVADDSHDTFLGLEAPRELELVASGWALDRTARVFAERSGGPGGIAETILRLADGDPAYVTAATVAEAAGQGDRLAQSILRRSVRCLAQALAHAVTLLAPRRVILGGGVSLMDESLWLRPIREGLEDRVFSTFRGTFDLVAPALGETVVVHGALALALERSND